VFLFLVGSLSVGVLVTFVVPRFAALFRGLGQDLPWTTRALLSVSGFMAHYWWVLLLSLAVFAAAFCRTTLRGKGRLAWDAFKLDLPLVGDLIVKMETSRFARTLSALLSNGVPMLSALEVVGEAAGNKRMASDILTARDDVQKGASLSEALAKRTRFSAVTLNLIRIGETSGATPEMLEKAASVYDREVERAARALTVLLEPVLIILMAGCVAFVVMSILLPVFNLNLVVQ